MVVKFFLLGFIAFFSAFFIGCGPIESLFPSAGNYKINIQINDIPLDDCSFAVYSDKIRPYFEDSVFDDPDVTALTVFLRNTEGAVAGWKVTYTLDKNAEQNEKPLENNGALSANKEDNSDDDADTEQNTGAVINNDDIKNNDEREALSEDTGENSNEAENAEAEANSMPDEDSMSEKNADTESSQTQTVKPQDKYKNGDELIIPVKNLNNLPFFPIPNDLPMGKYIIVSAVMSGNDILQKTEKTFYYLGRNNFSYNSINVNLPGIAGSSQLIPTGTVVMLEADVKFDGVLDPYIEWYNGKRKIAEGKISGGADKLFWKAPEESGFYSVSAIVYPIENYQNLLGYNKEISMLVAAKSLDMHLVKEDVPPKQGLRLTNWYVFEGNLHDSKTISSEKAENIQPVTGAGKVQSAAEQKISERSITHAKNAPKWKAARGTYGVVTGNDNILNLPKIAAADKDHENWQLLFRIKLENEGGILSVKFREAGQSDKINDVFLHLSFENSKLILSLTSPSETVSQVYNFNVTLAENIQSAANNSSKEIPDEILTRAMAESDLTEIADNEYEEDAPLAPDAAADSAAADSVQAAERVLADEGSFITVGVMFSIQSESISAQINILGDYIDSKLIGNPITVKTEDKKEFQIMLGFLRENNASAVIKTAEDSTAQKAIVRHEFTALWDELALYCMPRNVSLAGRVSSRED